MIVKFGQVSLVLPLILDARNNAGKLRIGRLTGDRNVLCEVGQAWFILLGAVLLLPSSKDATNPLMTTKSPRRVHTFATDIPPE